MSFLGIILAICSFIAVLALFGIEFIRGFTTPYTDIITYVLIPGGLITGLLLVALGAWREHRRRHITAKGCSPPLPRIDLSISSHRNTFIAVLVIAFSFLIFSALGTYRVYQFTESVRFCGLLCHSVLKPEYTLYKRSPHARVRCTECHVGPGANFVVKSKFSGVYQIYATIAKKYPRPIPTPVKNLRPARETCEECHWSEMFSGSVERIHTHFRTTENNDPWTIRLLLKVGGGSPTRVPVNGIHWHMSPVTRVEYIATKNDRQEIPWVKVIHPDGSVTVYQSRGKELKADTISKTRPRLMDCIDCHNRPTHIYSTPDKAMDDALLFGRIDRSIPFIKKNGFQALVESGKISKTESEGLENVKKKLMTDYSGYRDKNKILIAISEIQRIFRENFFPEMKASWQCYPDNIGHSIWPGCMRCHDGQHVSSDGKKISHDCNTCHLIISQGFGVETKSISPEGLKFDHPGGEISLEFACSDCHKGALVE